MKLDDSQDASWTEPLVRQYMQTAASGFPYIRCPDELRPSSASADSWWVIYAPNADGGAIIEGFRIDELRWRQRMLFIAWCLVGLLIYYELSFGHYFGWALAFVICWVLVLLLSTYILTRLLLTGRVWIHFPLAFREALRVTQKRRMKAETSERRKEAVGDGFGRFVGGVSGLLIEISAGKAAGKVSEMAVEAACKALARQIMSGDHEKP